MESSPESFLSTFVQTWFFNSVVGKIVAVFVGTVIVWAIIQILQRRLIGTIEDSQTRYRTRKLLTLGGYMLTLLLLTIVYSDKLGGLTVALGVAGAGIAFALQEVIASAAGWLAIAFGGFYSIGDRVQLGGIKGDVIDIGVLRTTLMETGQWVDGDLYNGRIVRIANSFVFKEPVFNYSGDFPFLWDEIKLPIQYGSNYEQARILIANVAHKIVDEYAEKAHLQWAVMVNKYMIEEASTEPIITLVANDNWVEFTLRYTVEFKKRRGTKDRLFTEILSAVEATNGTVKFASATFQLVEVPELKIRMTTKKDT